MNNNSDLENLENLEKFLISHSKINKKFIIDFFGFQKKTIYKEYKPFVINLDDVAYWLDSFKGNLKNTLIESYNKLDDYKIIKLNSLLPNHKRDIYGGQNKETVLITPDCFKMLCLRSKTKKAETVRKYYIELEKLIDEYKDKLIEKLDTKINILKNDLKKDKLPSGKYCYIFEETDELGEKYYRLGQSNNLKKRMYNHNSSNIHKKIISFKIKTENILHFEVCLRGIMFDFRYKNNKDYYKISKKYIEKAITQCDSIVKKFKNKSCSEKLIGGYKVKKMNNNNIDGTFDYKIMNTRLKILISKITFNIVWNLFDSYKEGYYNGKIMTLKQLKKEILPKSESNKLLLVSCHRDNLFSETINLGYKQITYDSLFKILYIFYNKNELTLSYLNNLPNDIYSYVNDAIININKGKKVYRIDLIGNLCRFEGIELLNKDNNIYQLILGS